MAVAFEDVTLPGRNYPTRKVGWHEGYEAVRLCKVAWANSQQFMFENLYKYWPNAYGGGGAICIEASAEPFPESEVLDGGNGLVAFEYALVTLRYTTNITINGNTIGFERLRSAGKAWRPCEAGLFWDGGDPLQPNDVPHLSTPGLIYERGYIGVDHIPLGVFVCPNTCNAGPVTSWTLNVTFMPETLQFVDLALDRNISITGGQGWKIVYSFHWLPNFDPSGAPLGHNGAWRPDGANGPGFYRIYNAAGQQYKPCLPSNFNLLWA